MTDDIEQTLQNVLRMHLPAAEPDLPLPMHTNLVDLGLDSLGAVNLVLDLEDTFGVELPDSVLTEATFATAESLRVAILGLMNADADAARS